MEMKKMQKYYLIYIKNKILLMNNKKKKVYMNNYINYLFEY